MLIKIFMAIWILTIYAWITRNKINIFCGTIIIIAAIIIYISIERPPAY